MSNKKPRKLKTHKDIIDIDGTLKEIVTVKDETGKILHKLIFPLKSEFHLRDLLQVMVGASILAIPVGFTEETWQLGDTLPFLNIIGLLILSVLFIASFVYYNYYKKKFMNNKYNFTKRVFLTYVISFAVVAIILSLINKAPWATDWLLAFKRTIIVAFPSSMSAAVADMIK